MLSAPSSAWSLSLRSPALLVMHRQGGCCHPPPALGIVSSAVLNRLPPGRWKPPSEWGLRIMNPQQPVNKQRPAHMPSCSQDPGDSSLTRVTMFSDPLPARYGTVRLETAGSRGCERQGASCIQRALLFHPGPETAACTPTPASSEDERAEGWGDVGGERDKNAYIGWPRNLGCFGGRIA